MNHCVLTDMQVYLRLITVLCKYDNQEFLYEPLILYHAIWKLSLPVVLNL
jgi:hypothetical protein